jgi:regulatory protein
MAGTTVAALRRGRSATASVEVELDDGRRFRVHERRVPGLGLAAGAVLDESAVARLASVARADDGERRLLRLLARRGRSRREALSRLAGWGVAGAEAQEVVDRLERAGLVDDRRLAAELAASRRRTGHGRLRVRADLHRLGVAEAGGDEREDAGDDAGEGERAAAAGLLRRRLGEPPWSAADRRRGWALLARRGFDAETAEALLGAGHLGVDADAPLGAAEEPR